MAARRASLSGVLRDLLFDKSANDTIAEFARQKIRSIVSQQGFELCALNFTEGLLDGIAVGPYVRRSRRPAFAKPLYGTAQRSFPLSGEISAVDHL